MEIAIDSGRDITDPPGSVDFAIRSIEGARVTQHCSGVIAWVDAPQPKAVDFDGIRSNLGVAAVNSDELYRALGAMGLHYGPAHRTLLSADVGDGELLATLQLPEALSRGGRDAHVLHPALMDGAVQSVVALMMQGPSLSSDPPVPFALDVLRILAPCPDQAMVWLRDSGRGVSGHGNWTFDLDICDEAGVVCIEMRGFVLRAAGNPSTGDDPVADRTESRDSSGQESTAGDEASAFFRRLIDAVADNTMSVEEALALS